ncbi:helix-turn-helix transcriptional regulator [Nocardia neocaledoniensis]|uniref:helix-turn-helix transcriptional regulator n=1 Tax=Nocardia neocaledoniensis TaxID=236511 RepID=UPI0024542CD9|nr:YafY family protein [Nocardia neocaledoniensis]
MPRPTGRVLTLLELLQSGGTWTMAELAGRLGVDPRTVRRYVDHLTALDVPVESVRGRYGGYRLAPGYRLPPLMFSDDEALAVLLGLILSRRAGSTTAQHTANETASGKIWRVLPERLAERLDTLLDALAFTDRPGEFGTPAAGMLLTIADAVRHHRPISIRYTDRHGRHSERTVHAHGIVAHSGRWYVTGSDPRVGEDRTFRLERITDVRTLPGTFDPPEHDDPAQRVLSGFATADYRHEVSLRIHGTVEHIRAHLPAGVARLTEHEPALGHDQAAEGWLRVEIRAEQLDWLPSVLAALDRPFVIERPDELRDLVTALATRLAFDAGRARPQEPAPGSPPSGPSVD